MGAHYRDLALIRLKASSRDRPRCVLCGYFKLLAQVCTLDDNPAQRNDVCDAFVNYLAERAILDPFDNVVIPTSSHEKATLLTVKLLTKRSLA